MTAPAPTVYPRPDNFLLAEDEAIKSHLRRTVRVSDAGDGSRPVPVFFGMPEKELHELSYPVIIVELVDLAEATERVHRGPARPWLTYEPAGYSPPPAGMAESKVHLPTPYDLTYQITTLARHPRHDRQMLAGLNVGPLGVRGSGLPVAADKTIRRMDRVGFAKRDTVDGNRKRVFRNVFTYRVSAELFPQQWQAITRTANRVVINPPQPRLGSLASLEYPDVPLTELQVATDAQYP